MSTYVWGDDDTQFFYHLSPEIILSSIDRLGFQTTGRCLALNSMENRVYEIEIESDSAKPSEHFLIAKFYRPGRWTREQILEEHQFLNELQEDEIPVVAPIAIDGQTLFDVDPHKLMFCIFPKQGGRAPQDLHPEMLQIMGRLLARMHNVGVTHRAPHRLHINPETFGRKNLEFLVKQKVIPARYHETYVQTVNQICDLIDPLFQNISVHRIHGDCHLGNVITRDDTGIFFIDFDDMLVGPAIQDVWLLVSGDDEDAIRDRQILLEAYDSMRSFDFTTIKLIEPLRSLRLIHFTAWITKRWEDPAFKHAFSHYGTEQYWETQTRDLQSQLQKIQNSLSIPRYDADFDRWS